jgi:hypothetical protein
MNATVDATTAVGAVAPVNQVRAHEDANRRVVEAADRTTLRTATEDATSSDAPVLQLVRKSAQQFLRLLASGAAAASAAALTGFTAVPTRDPPDAKTGGRVDTYA